MQLKLYNFEQKIFFSNFHSFNLGFFFQKGVASLTTYIGVFFESYIKRAPSSYLKKFCCKEWRKHTNFKQNQSKISNTFQSSQDQSIFETKKTTNQNAFPDTCHLLLPLFFSKMLSVTRSFVWQFQKELWKVNIWRSMLLPDSSLSETMYGSFKMQILNLTRKENILFALSL